MLASPLRYPGGKAKLFYYFTEVIRLNGFFDRTYCEPYAGGAGLALKLLSAGFVQRISINDIDESIFAFWKSVVEQPESFCQLISETPITIEEWYAQREIWRAKDTSEMLRLGFATFFLNRTNRSGIIEGAGPIGGYRQDGPWKLDVRLNRKQLIQQVRGIAAFADRIEICNSDALVFTQSKFEKPDTFCYLDPPYYVKGSKLYRSFYRHDDHCQIAELLEKHRNAKWVVSYDDVPEIRSIYRSFSPISYSLSYSAGTKASGNEVIFFSDNVVAPQVSGFVDEAA